MGEALGAIELTTGLLDPALDPIEDEDDSTEPLADLVDDVNEGEVVAEVMAPAEIDELVKLVELGEDERDADERLFGADVDAEADAGEEVIDAVVEAKSDEVSSSSPSPPSSSVIVGVGSSPSSVIVEVGSSPSSSLIVMLGVSSSSSEDVLLALALGVMLEDDMSMTMEVTLVLPIPPMILELVIVDENIAEADVVVVVVVVVGPMELVLPGMRLR